LKALTEHELMTSVGDRFQVSTTLLLKKFSRAEHMVYWRLSLWLIIPMILLSSAKSLQGWNVSFGMSFMKTVKRIGPRTLPCGTPDSTSHQSEAISPMTTLWIRLLRKEEIQPTSLSSKPLDVNFFSSPEWDNNIICDK